MRKINLKNKTRKFKKYKGGASGASGAVTRDIELGSMIKLFEKLKTIKPENNIKEIIDLLNEHEGLSRNKIVEISKIMTTIRDNKSANNQSDVPKINLAIQELTRNVQKLATRKYKKRGAIIGSYIGEAAGHGTQVALAGTKNAAVGLGRAIGAGFRATRNRFRKKTNDINNPIVTNGAGADGADAGGADADGAGADGAGADGALFRRINDVKAKRDARDKPLVKPTGVTATVVPTVTAPGAPTGAPTAPRDLRGARFERGEPTAGEAKTNRDSVTANVTPAPAPTRIANRKGIRGWFGGIRNPKNETRVRTELGKKTGAGSGF